MMVQDISNERLRPSYSSRSSSDCYEPGGTLKSMMSNLLPSLDDSMDSHFSKDIGHSEMTTSMTAHTSGASCNSSHADLGDSSDEDMTASQRRSKRVTVKHTLKKAFNKMAKKSTTSAASGSSTKKTKKSSNKKSSKKGLKGHIELEGSFLGQYSDDVSVDDSIFADPPTVCSAAPVQSETEDEKQQHIFSDDHDQESDQPDQRRLSRSSSRRTMPRSRPFEEIISDSSESGRHHHRPSRNSVRSKREAPRRTKSGRKLKSSSGRRMPPKSQSFDCDRGVPPLLTAMGGDRSKLPKRNSSFQGRDRRPSTSRSNNVTAQAAIPNPRRNSTHRRRSGDTINHSSSKDKKKPISRSKSFIHPGDIDVKPSKKRPSRAKSFDGAIDPVCLEVSQRRGSISRSKDKRKSNPALNVSSGPTAVCRRRSKSRSKSPSARPRSRSRSLSQSRRFSNARDESEREEGSVSCRRPSNARDHHSDRERSASRSRCPSSAREESVRRPSNAREGSDRDRSAPSSRRGSNAREESERECSVSNAREESERSVRRPSNARERGRRSKSRSRRSSSEREGDRSKSRSRRSSSERDPSRSRSRRPSASRSSTQQQEHQKRGRSKSVSRLASHTQSQSQQRSSSKAKRQASNQSQRSRSSSRSRRESAGKSLKRYETLSKEDFQVPKAEKFDAKGRRPRSLSRSRSMKGPKGDLAEQINPNPRASRSLSRTRSNDQEGIADYLKRSQPEPKPAGEEDTNSQSTGSKTHESNEITYATPSWMWHNSTTSNFSNSLFSKTELSGLKEESMKEESIKEESLFQHDRSVSSPAYDGRCEMSTPRGPTPVSCAPDTSGNGYSPPLMTLNLHNSTSSLSTSATPVTKAKHLYGKILKKEQEEVNLWSEIVDGFH